MTIKEDRFMNLQKAFHDEYVYIMGLDKDRYHNTTFPKGYAKKKKTKRRQQKQSRRKK